MSAEERDASESVESDRTGEGKAEEAQDAMSGYASADLLDSEVSEKPQNSSTLDESFQAIPAFESAALLEGDRDARG
jgi:hypothetical protein